MPDSEDAGCPKDEPPAASGNGAGDAAESLEDVLNALQGRLISEIETAVAKVLGDPAARARPSARPPAARRSVSDGSLSHSSASGRQPQREKAGAVGPCLGYQQREPSFCSAGSLLSRTPTNASSMVTHGLSSGKNHFLALRRPSHNIDLTSQLFGKIDVDGSGYVTKTEIIRALKNDDSVIALCQQTALAPLLNIKLFKHAFDALDEDKNGTLSPEEFASAVKMVNELHQENDSDTCTSGATSGAGVKLDVVNRGAFNVDLKAGCLDKEVYHVEDFYWRTGCCQAVARSEIFHNTMIFIICLNAVYIGVDIEHNKADELVTANWFFMGCEILFFVVFLVEIVIRFVAFEKKVSALKDAWFCYDSVLVLLMVIETLLLPTIMPLFSENATTPELGFMRLLRLLRLSRIVRLMRSVPELITITRGIRAGLRAVSATFVMVVLLVYVFAIMMVLLLKGDIQYDETFSTLPMSMGSLVVQGILWDGTKALLGDLWGRGDFHTTLASVVFLTFILFATVTVLNLLSGVLVEVVSAVSASEREEAATNLMKEIILKELHHFDDGDGMISEEELHEVMLDPNALKVLERIGVDIDFLQSYQIMCYQEADATIPIYDLMVQMLMCRRQQSATMGHLIILQQLIVWNLVTKLGNMEQRLNADLDRRFEYLLAHTVDQIQSVRTCLHREGFAPEAKDEYSRLML